AGDRVTVNLKFESQYGQHTFGRVRLSQSASQDLSQWAKHDLGPWHYVGPIFSETNSRELLEVALPPEEGYDAARTYGDAKLQWARKPEWPDGEVVRFEGKDEAAH